MPLKRKASENSLRVSARKRAATTTAKDIRSFFADLEDAVRSDPIRSDPIRSDPIRSDPIRSDSIRIPVVAIPRPNAQLLSQFAPGSPVQPPGTDEVRPEIREDSTVPVARIDSIITSEVCSVVGIDDDAVRLPRAPSTSHEGGPKETERAKITSIAQHNGLLEASNSSARRRSGRARNTIRSFFEADVDEEFNDKAHAKASRRSRFSSDAESDFAPEGDPHSDHDDLLSAEASDSDIDPGDPDEDLESDDSRPRRRRQDQKKPPARKHPAATSKKLSKQPGLALDGNATLTTKKRMTNIAQGLPRALDLTLPPINNVKDAFGEMVASALGKGLGKAVTALRGRILRVATMCSGTESPLLALDLIRDILKSNGRATFEAVHLFSAEIVPYKQAYIERNFKVPLIFRDITELTGAKDRSVTATTAYGARVEVPGDVDLIIAGTACVDYSMLNASKKSIDESGESGDTFRAVLAYAKVWRPRMLILENVFTAPWDGMLARYEEIGYRTAGVLLDSKNFYIPQTRQRGYMFCIDAAACETDKQAGAVAEQWVANMLALRRPASSPTTAFMLSSDDPAVLRSSALALRRSLLETTVREVDWSKCLLRHIQYRREQEIGSARPYTSWTEGGSLQLFENADVSWFRGMVERIWDMIDCLYMQKSLPKKGCYDINFKSRIINVSQNVDRNPDTTPAGLAQCITPSGIFYVTDRGGPLSPDETLALQGLPLDKISFTTETNRQIQDMAGNAMTSTVVGASILAALMAAPSDALGSVSSDDAHEKVVATEVLDVVPFKSLHATLSERHDALNIHDLLRDAASSSQKCHCEGPFDLSKKAIQVCRDCGHTSCLACGGKPQHNYDTSHVQRASRLDPATFHRRYKALFPPHLQFRGAESVQALLLSKKVDAAYLCVVKSAVSEKFQFTQLARGRHWSVIWHSQTARLVLHLDPVGCRWELYALPESKLPANDPLRAFLQRAIGEAHLLATSDMNDLFTVEWRWRYPDSTKQHVEIIPGSDCTSSWRGRLQLPNYENEVMPNSLDFELKGKNHTLHSICGTYNYLPRCGTACESLYKRVDSRHGHCYLMLDPDPVGDPESDAMVFTDDLEPKKYGQFRRRFARLSSDWRAWSKDSGTRTMSTEVHGDESWCTTQSVSLAALPLELTVAYLDSASVSGAALLDCRHAVDLITFAVPSNKFTSDVISFRDMSWMFTAVHAAFPPITDHILTDMQSECATCLPGTASLRWKWTSDGTALRPYEHPALATEYEAKLKARPETVQLHTTVSDGLLKISVRLNLATLAHRATSKLLRFCNFAVIKPQISWSVDPMYTETSGLDLPVFSLQNNDRDLAVTTLTDLKITLWPKQQRSLTWMLSQEEDEGREYVIEEAEEHIIPSVGWRVEAKASYKHKVKGGIQASHPGFGKTICTLALIRTDYANRAANDIIASMSCNPADGHGPIPHIATLVVAPKTLVEQWKSEVDKVLGRDFAHATIAISQITQLAKHTIDNFLKARIVIVSSDLLTSDSYVKRLAAFAGVPEPSDTKGRQYAVWLKFVSSKIYEHASIMRKSGKGALHKQIKKVYQQHQDDPEFTTYVPSKRLKGQAYTNKISASVEGRDIRIPNLDQNVLASTGHPLFEMFHYNRIVVDEFTYLSPKDYAAIENLNGDKRWALSATAKLQDPYDIAKMADLIGVKLRVSENAPGALSTSNFKAVLAEKTDFEQFQTFRASASMATTRRTFELAQDFLDAFVRQNILEFDDFPYQDHLMPISLTYAHRLVYTEVSQHLNSADMRIRKMKASENRDREKQIADILEDVQSAEEALVRLAAAFKGDNYGAIDGRVTLDAIAARRSEQANKAKAGLANAIEEVVSMAQGQADPLFESWTQNIVKVGSLGDEDSRATVSGLLDAARTNRSASKTTTGNVKAQLSTANDLAKHYMTMLRSIRFVQNCKALLSTTSHGQCDSLSCPATGATLSVSSLCGHLICDLCWRSLQESTGICSAAGCNAQIFSYHLLRSEKLKQAQSASVDAPQGAKVKAVMDLLTTIANNKEQAILFVQYPEQIDDMKLACDAAAVRAVAVQDNSAASAQVTKFQTEVDVRSRSTVIILNLSGSSAAGINLTNANHVLFLSPLLADSQYNYDAAIAQAIGRVRRPGQTRNIHVYRFVALDTIDVDILEHRERRDLALSEFDADAEESKGRTPPVRGGAGQNQAMPERTQLIKDSKGIFRLMPKSWLIGENEDLGAMGVEGRARVAGYEDFSSLIKFSKAYSEDD